jgi:glycosidase
MRFFLVIIFCLFNLSVLAKDFIHVPSPNWEDQIIYFAVVDRFNDGDSSNNDQKAGEYDPKQNNKYSGGDIKGVIEKIPYMKKLGVTAVWLTPVLANQWWNPWANMSGYHGYWTENFMKIDKHKGSLEDYKKLSSELHKNGMYLIKDVVCNHVGNFFRYNGKYNPKDLAENFELNLASKPGFKPSQYPFNMNDVRDPEQRKMDIYNWTPEISDYRNKKQKLTYQMSGLDDLNTDNELVRKTLLDSYKYWIEEVGVDGFRVDTAIYVDHDFWRFFNPGIENFAKKLGKDDFLMFAETWFNSEAMSEKADKNSAKYLGSFKKPEFNSLINFALQNDTERVFGNKASTSYLSYRLKSLFKNYQNPYRLVNFIDNHDMNRFLASYGKNSFVQALTFIMTIPGIPSLYYGSEQGLSLSRGSMFADGYGSGGKNHFNTDSEYFNLLKKIISVRKENPFFRNGKLTVLRDSKNGPGIFAYKMENKEGTGVIIFNTASQAVLMNELETGFKKGTALKKLFSYMTAIENLSVGEEGKISKIIDPGAVLVLKLEGKTSIYQEFIASIKINNMRNGSSFKNNFELKGKIKLKDTKREDIKKISKFCKLKLVMNSIFDDAIDLKIENVSAEANLDYRKWRVEVPVDNLMNGRHDLTVLGVDDKNNICALSKTYSFKVKRPFFKIAEYKDFIGDDAGPKGKYLYPSHESFNANADIESVSLYRSGNNLKISIKMVNPISVAWNPKNGFDHLTFAIYMDLPDNQDGVSYMPYQNYEVPQGLKWNYMMFLAGWTNLVYSSKGSSTNNFGKPVNPSPKIFVNKKNRTIDVLISAKTLAYPKDISGTKLYISTWDYDGMESKYRPLLKEPEAFAFGGGSKKDPYVMDDTNVVFVP